MTKQEYLSTVVRLRNELKDEITTSFFSQAVSNTYWMKRKKKIDDIYNEMDFAWADYITGTRHVYEKARWDAIKVARQEVPELNQIPFQREADPEDVQEFQGDSVENFNNIIIDSKKSWILLMRLLELRNKQERGRIEAFKAKIEAYLEEDEIQQIIAEAESYPAARTTLIEELMDQADEDKFIVTIQQTGKRKGKPIKWNVKKYAEKMLRTQTRMLQTQGALDAARMVDTDLVQVSSHNTTCPICVEYEGKIYSISGTSPIFPPLDDEPPYHPYCKHSLTPTFMSVLSKRGIQPYIDFSQGRSDIHPTVRNWIPISERNIRAA